MKRDFLVILWLGMRGNFFFEGQFFFKMFSGVLDRIIMVSEGIIGYRAFCGRLHILKDCNIMVSL